MATYKVIQDIEAEDKLVGPFSLRQFIYAGIAVVCGYLSFICVAKGAAFLLVALVPPMLFCMFFAWPWSPDQPTEVWALARIRFFFKPRRRIWDQSGMKDLVTITAPKRVERAYTDGLSQTEVKSRLSALADTIDSRGWAVKNSAVNLSAAPTYGIPAAAASDRLIAFDSMPAEVPNVDIQAADDILDEQSNPIAQQFDSMISASSQAHRQKIIQQMEQADKPQLVTPKRPDTPGDYWFLNQPKQPAGSNAPADSVMFANPQVVQPGTDQAVGPVAATPTADEQALSKQIREQNQVSQHAQNMHLKTIKPIGDQPTAAAAQQPVGGQTTAATPQSDAAILNLASNNDLNVDVIARQAQKAREPEQPDDEVVIPLR